jgi:cell division protein FtsN
MLASTVQFSNNDQPPITPLTSSECTGAGIPKTQTQQSPYLQTPNSVPDPTCPSSHSTPKSSTSEEQPVVPSSQRSTHEQPAPNIRRCTGP